ncbi:hypothetical protein STRIP9103_02779 [Streptomyces ipomoeae 91-03]|uniref:Uncharacterized protein n=1 Tax=Streptomyces ipomoeae 91-03 TaxID=698759 RepID=L1L8F8_9ACTN|nr:hypothetical protein STRIP9103_02779 [Streptomyces ipomoeae 91-03]
MDVPVRVTITVLLVYLFDSRATRGRWCRSGTLAPHRLR